MSKMVDNVLTELKILIIGESSVGKSCFFRRFKDNEFSDVIPATVGTDFTAKLINVDDNLIRLHIWDTAGQERFSALTPNFYRDAHGAILMYDVNNKHSFDKLYHWMEELGTYSTKLGLVKMVVGNKIDTPNLRQVQQENGCIFAKANHALFAETSAKASVGVNDVFENLTRKILQTPNLWYPTSDRIIQRDSICLNRRRISHAASGWRCCS